MIEGMRSKHVGKMTRGKRPQRPHRMGKLEKGHRIKRFTKRARRA